ncbi:MAG: PH domain-containing protein, partial [Abditibacteriota bacterium]|nr:PH domain-containing protein [Abditibacteriota bacterium]
TGTRKSYTTMPYSKIQYFSIQTPGFLELIPDSELFIMFSNTFTAKFDFKGNVDIGKIGRMISKYVLE